MPSRLLAGAFLSLAFAHLHTQPMRPPASTTPCSSFAWTDPRPLLLNDGQRAVALRFSSAATRQRHWVAAGNLMPNLFDRSAGWGDLRLIRDGEAMVGPPASERMAHPKVVIGPGREIHVLWAETSEGRPRTSLTDWLAPRAQSLWAVTHSGDGWREPERIAQGPLIWGKSFIDEPTTAGSHAVVALRRFLTASSKGMVAVLVHDGKEWIERSVPGTEDALAMSVATDGTRLHVSAAVPGATGSRSVAILLATSPDWGRTWDPPRTLGVVDEATVPSLRARVTRDGRLQVLAVEAGREGGSTLRVYPAGLSGEGGPHPTGLSFPKGMNGLQVAEDGCGALHAVFESYDQRTQSGSLMHATWDGEWRLMPLAPSLRGLDVALLTSSDGGLRLFFLAQPQDSPPKSDYELYEMRWRDPASARRGR